MTKTNTNPGKFDKASDISYNTKCTEEFYSWVNRLDRSLRIRVDQHLLRLTDGNPGFHKRFDNILEIKWKTGAMGSFRLYCAEFNDVILLIGGNKNTQNKDIQLAQELLKEVKNGKARTRIYEKILR